MQIISFIIYDPKEENISIVRTFLPSTSGNIKENVLRKRIILNPILVFH